MTHLDPEEQEAETVLAKIKDAIAPMMEHFESVQVIAVRRRENGWTQTLRWGQGDWYARYGAVRGWLLEEEGKMARGERDDG